MVQREGLDEENLNPVDCTRFADWPGPFVNLNPVDSTRFWSRVSMFMTRFMSTDHQLYM
jgi:hypothetical protein